MYGYCVDCMIHEVCLGRSNSISQSFQSLFNNCQRAGLSTILPRGRLSIHKSLIPYVIVSFSFVAPVAFGSGCMQLVPSGRAAGALVSIACVHCLPTAVDYRYLIIRHTAAVVTIQSTYYDEVRHFGAAVIFSRRCPFILVYGICTICAASTLLKAHLHIRIYHTHVGIILFMLASSRCSHSAVPIDTTVCTYCTWSFYLALLCAPFDMPTVLYQVYY